MDASDVLVGLSAFLGAGVGSAMAYVATRGQTCAEREARRREEWGRRFTTALESFTSYPNLRLLTPEALDQVELVRDTGSDEGGGSDRADDRGH